MPLSLPTVLPVPRRQILMESAPLSQRFNLLHLTTVLTILSTAKGKIRLFFYIFCISKVFSQNYTTFFVHFVDTEVPESSKRRLRSGETSTDMVTGKSFPQLSTGFSTMSDFHRPRFSLYGGQKSRVCSHMAYLFHNRALEFTANFHVLELSWVEFSGLCTIIHSLSTRIVEKRRGSAGNG